MVVPSVLNPTILDMVLILTNRRCHGGPSRLLERLTVLAGAAPGGCRRGTAFLARQGTPLSRHLLFLVPSPIARVVRGQRRRTARSSASRADRRRRALELAQPRATRADVERVAATEQAGPGRGG